MTKDLRTADKVALGGNWALAQSHGGKRVPCAACALCMENEKIFITQDNAIKKYTTRSHPMPTCSKLGLRPRGWIEIWSLNILISRKGIGGTGKGWCWFTSLCRQVPVIRTEGYMFIVSSKKKMIRGPKMGGHRKTRLMSEEKLIKSRISVLFFFPLNVSALCCTHTI